MITKVNNGWITLDEQRNEVTVQRAFAGLNTMVGEPIEGLSEVKQCIVYYHERELYPNGEVIKTELKNYTLTDLDYTEEEINNILYYMDAMPVLTGFVNSIGYNGIINPCRETLEDIDILPVSVENSYPLRRDTRVKSVKKL
jgi:hypothetical protein